MAKTKILISAAQQEEIRAVIVDDSNKILDLILEHPGQEEKVNNIYKAVVSSMESSLNACFLDFGAGKHGFLPFKDIPASAIPTPQKTKQQDTEQQNQETQEQKTEKKVTEEKKSADTKETSKYIQQLTEKVKHLKEDQEIIVQVDKGERGSKGAALTAEISLAGRYLVLMPLNSKAGGISRRIEGEDRETLKSLLKQLKKPEKMGVIIRTSGINKTLEELQWDLDILLEKWDAIKNASESRKAPFLILQESGAVNRIIRDYLSPNIDKIIVDEKALFEEIKEYLSLTMPKFLEKLEYYSKETSLFSDFGVESQIESVYQPSVRLPSGGSIVVDHTEALVAIDVNSSRATRASDIEATALHTNLEAAEEIARQLRLRDIGGLVVIDFIDMMPIENQKEVETKLRSSLKADRARVQIGRISRFGLLEMSRQRLKPSLREEAHIPCPRCQGQGRIRSAQSVALSILRVVEEDAIKGRTAKIHLQVPVDIATFLLNEKRKELAKIETSYGLEVVVLPNLNLQSPHYQIRRSQNKNMDSEKHKKNQKKSIDSLSNYEEINELNTDNKSKNRRTKPAVDFVASKAAPTPSKISTGLFKRLLTSVFGNSEEEKTKQHPAQKTGTPRPQRKRSSSPSRRRPYNKNRSGKSYHNRDSQKRTNRSTGSNRKEQK